MILSLNEVEVMATKAAAGAGRPWGLAQEAGWATAVLEAMGLPGATLLLALLRVTDRIDCNILAPHFGSDGRWRANGPLCPILCGAYIQDMGGLMTPITVPSLHAPMLLIPFVQAACPDAAMDWDRADITIHHSQVALRGDPTTTMARHVTIRPVQLDDFQTSVFTHSAQPSPVDIPDEMWEGLSAFAHRTYVPASEASRLNGAGAGLTDND